MSGIGEAVSALLGRPAHFDQQGNPMVSWEELHAIEVEHRQPAADWDKAYEAVYRHIRTLPSGTDRQAVRNASIWRAVNMALDAANPLQPNASWPDPREWYDVAPIERTLPDGDIVLICPRCSHPIDHTPTHDVSIDGMGLSAVPDEYHCERCEYRYQD